MLQTLNNEKIDNIDQLFKNIQIQQNSSKNQQHLKCKFICKRIKYQNDIYKEKLANIQEELQYKGQAHDRQLQNQRVIMQHQLKIKVTQIKQHLREQYHALFMNEQKLQAEVKNKTTEIQLLTNKNKRLQEYTKLLESQQQQIKASHTQQLTSLQDKIQSLHKKYTQNQQTVKSDIETQYKIKLNNLKDDIVYLESKVLRLQGQINNLQDEVKKSKQDNVKLRITNQQIKIINGRQINQLEVRLKVLRQNTADDYITQKKKTRHDNLHRIDCQYQQQYKSNNHYETIYGNTSKKYSEALKQQIQLQRSRLSELKDKRYQDKQNIVRDNQIIYGKIQKRKSSFFAEKLKSKNKSLHKQTTALNSTHNSSRFLNSLDTNLVESSIYISQIQSPTFAGLQNTS